MRILPGVLLSLSLVTPALANPAAGDVQQTPPPADAVQQAAPPADAVQQAAHPADAVQQAAPPADAVQQAAPPADAVQQAAPPADAVQPAAHPAAGVQQTPQGGPVMGGGFVGPSTPFGVTTVLQALNARDDTPCVLEGSIVQRVAGEDDEYIFRDSTGQILVEIDHELFWGMTVTPNNVVRLTGKVDGHFIRRNEIDAASLQVLR